MSAAYMEIGTQPRKEMESRRLSWPTVYSQKFNSGLQGANKLLEKSYPGSGPSSIVSGSSASDQFKQQLFAANVALQQKDTEFLMLRQSFEELQDQMAVLMSELDSERLQHGQHLTEAHQRGLEEGLNRTVHCPKCGATVMAPPSENGAVEAVQNSGVTTLHNVQLSEDRKEEAQVGSILSMKEFDSALASNTFAECKENRGNTINEDESALLWLAPEVSQSSVAPPEPEAEFREVHTSPPTSADMMLTCPEEQVKELFKIAEQALSTANEEKSLPLVSVVASKGSLETGVEGEQMSMAENPAGEAAQTGKKDSDEDKSPLEEDSCRYEMKLDGRSTKSSQVVDGKDSAGLSSENSLELKNAVEEKAAVEIAKSGRTAEFVGRKKMRLVLGSGNGSPRAVFSREKAILMLDNTTMVMSPRAIEPLTPGGSVARTSSFAPDGCVTPVGNLSRATSLTPSSSNLVRASSSSPDGCGTHGGNLSRSTSLTLGSSPRTGSLSVAVLGRCESGLHEPSSLQSSKLNHRRAESMRLSSGIDFLDIIFHLLQELDEEVKKMKFLQAEGHLLYTRIRWFQETLTRLGAGMDNAIGRPLRQLSEILKSAIEICRECRRGTLFRLLNFQRVSDDLASLGFQMDRCRGDGVWVEIFKRELDSEKYLIGLKEEAAESALLEKKEIDGLLGSAKVKDLGTQQEKVDAVLLWWNRGVISKSEVAEFQREVRRPMEENMKWQEECLLMQRISQALAASALHASSGEDGVPAGNGQEIPAHFICPLTFEIMQEPVMTTAGQSYERWALKEWFSSSKNNLDPLTSEEVTSTVPIPNVSLKNLIRAWEARKTSRQNSLESEADEVIPAEESSKPALYPDVPAGSLVPLADELLKTAPEDAVQLYLRAAEQGIAAAQCKLGACYEQGTGAPLDSASALKWYTQAAEQGYAIAENHLGDCYEQGIGVPRDSSVAAEWYLKAAQQGCRAAQNSLGDCYLHGNGVPVDAILALQWYTRAAEQGHAGAQFVVGFCHDKGIAVVRNQAKAAEWYRKGGEQGNDDAQNQLGECYLFGHGVDKDEGQAKEWFTKAANQGHAEARANLRKLKDEQEEARRASLDGEFREAAEEGLMSPVGSLSPFSPLSPLSPLTELGGRLSEDSVGLPLGGRPSEDGDEWFVKAVDWYEKAAKLGNKYAQQNLENLYETGGEEPAKAARFSEADFEKLQMQAREDALDLLWVTHRRSMEMPAGAMADIKRIVQAPPEVREHKLTQPRLSRCRITKMFQSYNRGTAKVMAADIRTAEQSKAVTQAKQILFECEGGTIPSDPAEALAWYTKAAEQGDADAQYVLGDRYQHGTGVQKDAAKAVEWFTKAAKQDHADAQYVLGYCYRYGVGVPKDFGQAFGWYKKAAEQGDCVAQIDLGICYQNGIGVGKDATKALEILTAVAETYASLGSNSPDGLAETIKGLKKKLEKKQRKRGRGSWPWGSR